MEMQDNPTTKRTTNRRGSGSHEVASNKAHRADGRVGRRKVKESIHCQHNAHDCKDTYHYTECGLDNVYLRCGYDIEDDAEYGEIVSIHDADELHRAIGDFLVRNKKILTGKELRFLRKEMDLTQAELGKWLGVTDQAVARWEKDKTDIPGSADYLIRTLFVDHLGQLSAGLSIRDLLSAVEKNDASREEGRHLFEHVNSDWKPTQQLAA